jgi:hypothetical protein
MSHDTIVGLMIAGGILFALLLLWGSCAVLAGRVHDSEDRRDFDE